MSRLFRILAMIAALAAGKACALAMGQTPDMRRSVVAVGMPIPGTNQMAQTVGTIIGMADGQATVRCR